MTRLLARLAALLLSAVLLSAASPAARAADKLTLLLDWHINPDHGPLFVALEKGYFADAGLEVRMIEPADPNDPPKMVAAGKAELAVSYQPQLHIQVAAGLPIVRIATLVATPLNTLMVMADGPIKTLADLKGRKIGYSVSSTEHAVLGTMLKKHKLTLKDVTLVNVNMGLTAALASGQVDAIIGGYRNFEMTQMELLGKKARAFYVEEEGVPAFDELILVTNRNLVNDKRLRRFVDALEFGVQFMVNRPDEAWQLFIKGRKSLDTELNRRAWRDTLARFSLTPAALDRARYERFAAFLKENNLVKTLPPLKDYAVELAW
ncbi:MAG: ABC transporter substrate-binding protein [Alphaproteobacteria bacterium]